MDCKHVNLDFESQIVMSARGYHDCPYITCLDCDEATPDGNCSDDTCNNY